MAVLFLLLFWIVARGQRYTARAREELAGMLLRERKMSGQLDRQNVELQQANRAKSQFLSLVSHELKTPLTSILAFSSSLHKKLGPGLAEREARQLEALARNGKQLKTLIDDLLDVSAAESGKLQLRFEDVSPDRLAKEVIESVQPLFDARQQLVTFSADGVEGVTVNGDRERLHQVLFNLLSNASKYSPEG
jgi:signal transduction histidine kinase